MAIVVYIIPILVLAAGIVMISVGLAQVRRGTPRTSWILETHNVVAIILGVCASAALAYTVLA